MSSSGCWATARALRGVRIAAPLSGAERCKRLESKVLDRVAAEASRVRRGVSMQRGASAWSVLLGFAALAALGLGVAWWLTRSPPNVVTATPAPVTRATPGDAPDD